MYRHVKLIVLLFMGVLQVSACASSSSTPFASPTDEEFDAAVADTHSTLNMVQKALLYPKPSRAIIV
jgi:hypothetical protein